jgi:hypothetical protein
VSACARRWRGSHACSVRVERAVHACARVQGAGQRAQAWQWRGEGWASPVRDMNCALCNSFLCGTERAACLLVCWNRRRGICCTAARTHRCCQLLTRPCAFLPMPSNPRKHKLRAIYNNDTRRCAEQACEHVLETAEQTQCLLPGPELASHLGRHNSCVTMTPQTAARNALSMLQLRRLWPLRAPHAPHDSCCTCCTVTVAVCSEVSSAHSRQVPPHAMDPPNAFTFHGVIGDGRASFGSMRDDERLHVNAAHFNSVASPRALPGGGSDACSPLEDLAALMQLTAWIKALGELIRMQDGSQFVDLRARAVLVLESWAQRWYDRQAISTA